MTLCRVCNKPFFSLIPFYPYSSLHCAIRDLRYVSLIIFVAYVLFVPFYEYHFVGFIIPLALSIYGFNIKIKPYKVIEIQNKFGAMSNHKISTTKKSKRIFVEELNKSLLPCCYQTYRLKEKYCACGRSVPGLEQ